MTVIDTIVTEIPITEEERIDRVTAELNELRAEGVEVNLTATELIILEDEGFLIDFKNNQILVNPEDVAS